MITYIKVDSSLHNINNLQAIMKFFVPYKYFIQVPKKCSYVILNIPIQFSIVILSIERKNFTTTIA